MQTYIVERWEMTPTEAFLLMGVVGDARLSQVCKPHPDEKSNVIVHFKMPKLQGKRRLIE